MLEFRDQYTSKDDVALLRAASPAYGLELATRHLFLRPRTARDRLIVFTQYFRLLSLRAFSLFTQPLSGSLVSLCSHHAAFSISTF